MLTIMKRILGCLVVILGIVITDKILVYVLVDDASSDVRSAMHELYQQEEIDSLFLGSSLVFCGYDPRILDEVWEENTYLAATPVQKIDGGYHLLKEVLKKNDVKTVYVDMFYRHFRDVPKERTDAHMEYIYYITDYMKNSGNKAEFLLNASGCEMYINSFFVPSRYGNYLLDLERFERVIKSKRNEDYTNYKTAEGFYKGALFSTGYVGNPNMAGELDAHNFAPIEEEVISDYSLKYLDKLVQLCKKENIRLVLVGTPITDLFLKSIGNYDVYYNYMKDYAKQKEIEYYDFNLCKTDILKFEREDFLDTLHLSGVGNEKYSRVFAKVMANYSKEERETLFYNSVEEKMNDLEKQTFGITYVKNSETDSSYMIDTVSNYDVNVEYRICIVDDAGNEVELIQDFMKNNILFINKNESKSYKITARDIISKKIYEEAVVSL